MQNPFWSSAGPRYVDRAEVFDLARETARQIAAQHPEVLKIFLFGSFARGDYGLHSDLDLLIVLRASDEAASERLNRFMDYAPIYPTDMLVYTDKELGARISGGDAFLARVLRESIQIWPVHGEFVASCRDGAE